MEADDPQPPTNPFKVASGTERVLALGERSREAEKLARLKFQLIQKEAQGREYVANMSRKRLNMKEDRSAVISDIKAIPTAIPYLAPHMDFSQRKPRRSPSPTES